MDIPFPPTSWHPTKPYESWEPPYTSSELDLLIRQLNKDTNLLHSHPYDPHLWIRRATTLSLLRYPELAVGDAHKACLLAQNLLAQLDVRPNSQVGARMGFWMGDPEIEEEGLEEEHERQQEEFAGLQSVAYKVVAENLEFFPNAEKGRFVPAGYPWMREEWQGRSDELLNYMNGEFEDPGNGGVDSGSGDAACVVRRYAFGRGVGKGEGKDLLGVFARRDLSEGEGIVVDESRTWGCIGPDLHGSVKNLFGGTGCMEPFHPNTESDSSAHGMRWIRDRTDRQASTAIMKCRLLLCCIEDNISHPLDHHLLARLTPTYRLGKWKPFSLEEDIAVIFDALQQFGVDIFANANYDTWVLFVLRARLDNNSWSDPNTHSLNSLFCLFNHSCEPNVQWRSQEDDHRVLHMTMTQDVKMGEQLFVEYDTFMSDKKLEERRRRLRRWFDEPCRCTRCVREEEEMGGVTEPLESSFSSLGEWDVEEKPEFPEDEDG